MLSVKGLKASVEGKEILRGLDLEIGRVAVLGPSGIPDVSVAEDDGPPDFCGAFASLRRAA